jgi:hypothetical protein
MVLMEDEDIFPPSPSIFSSMSAEPFSIMCEDMHDKIGAFHHPSIGLYFLL